MLYTAFVFISYILLAAKNYCCAVTTIASHAAVCSFCVQLLQAAKTTAVHITTEVL